MEYELQFEDSEGRQQSWVTGCADIADMFIHTPRIFVPTLRFADHIVTGIAAEYTGENRTAFQRLLEQEAAELNGHPKTIQTAVRGLVVKIATK